MENVELKFDGYFKYDDYVDLFEANAGIYVIYAGLDDNIMTKLLYIGESGNLFNRHHRHEKYDDWNAQLEEGEELYFSRVLIESKQYDNDNRCDIEAALIFHHETACNSKSTKSYNGRELHISIEGKCKFLDCDFFVNKSEKE